MSRGTCQIAWQSAILSHELTENIQATEPDRFIPPLRELAAQLVEEGNRGARRQGVADPGQADRVRRWGAAGGVPYLHYYCESSVFYQIVLH